jgi:hypothetical protein
MVTLCNARPVRCGCEGFYDESLYEEPHFSRILPYICRDVIVFKTDYVGQKQGADAIGYDVLERSLVEMIDIPATKAAAKTFAERLGCDRGLVFYVRMYVSM